MMMMMMMSYIMKADADDGSMTPSRNDRRYTLRSVQSSPGRSFLRIKTKFIYTGRLSSWKLCLCSCICLCVCLCLYLWRLQMKPGDVLFPTMYHMLNPTLKSFWRRGSRRTRPRWHRGTRRRWTRSLEKFPNNVVFFFESVPEKRLELSPFFRLVSSFKITDAVSAAKTKFQNHLM